MEEIAARFALTYPGFNLDVDLHLPGRGITALFGHSGSGKTTLLRLIAGLARTENGRLTFRGQVWQDEDTWLPTHRRPLGYVFQDANLLEHLSVAGNLQYGAKRSCGRQVNLDAAIELLGIGHLLERKPAQLSGGEGQRVAIARALSTAPSLLLMDEPLASLDLTRKQEILPYLERLHRELAIPVLYVSHAPDEVARLADHLVVMAEGRVVADGPLAETLARTDLPVRLGEEAGVVVEAVIVERDSSWQLLRLGFGAENILWCRDSGQLLGSRVRVRVLARDVAISLSRPQDSSVQNLLAGRIEAIANDEHPGLALIRVQVGKTPFLSRLTRRAVDTLALKVEREVWVQVKTVALLDQT
ncbi:MAG: molybdenum ABC transporter ATP-binding protein [Deltaproteobacteria bacterium RIFOXYD12_FULL_56_24]|nr:MAG: molybdenum ABC transporter ATP-binding protein [Deltaproteobacteria bacterium RIFOXYD12_FULL_56_24]